MPRSVTVTFADGTSHVYQNVPDDASPEQVEARAQQDFPSQQVTQLMGGDIMLREIRDAIASRQASMDDLRGIAQRYNRELENPEAAQAWIDYAADNPGFDIPADVATPPMGAAASTLTGFAQGLKGPAEFAQRLNPMDYIMDIGEDVLFPGQRQAREAGIENQMAGYAARAQQQHPNWFAGGEITGEIAGTAPLLFAGGGGIAAAGEGLAARAGAGTLARSGGRALQMLGRSFQTGGIGVRAPSRAAVEAGAPMAASRLSRTALRAAGGGASSAAAAGMTGRDMTDAALVGGGLPMVAHVGRLGAGRVYDWLRGRVGEVRAGEIMRNLIAENRTDIINALRAAPEDARTNTAEYLATQGLLTPELAAATRIATASDVGQPLERVAQARAAGQNQMREQLRGGATGTEAMQNIGAMRQNVRNVTDPMREENLWLSDVGRMEILPAEREAAAADALAAEINNSGLVRSMRGLEGRSQEQMDAVFQYPEFFTPGRTVERIGEVADQAGRRADEGIEAQLRLRGHAEGQRAIAANLRAQGLQPLDISGVVRRLRQQAAEAQFVNPARYRVMSEFADNLEARARAMGGVIDAAGLYELRKNMADTAAQLLGPVDPSALQRRTAELVGEVTPLIDTAIEEAGGAGWRQYLRTFEAGMRNVERQEFARELERLPENRFEQVMAGNDPDFVARFFGPGRYDVNTELFGAQLPVAHRLAGEIGASRDVAQSGLRDLPTSMRLSLPTGARNRVATAFEPGLKNVFARGLTRITAGLPGIYGGGVAADQLARAYSEMVAENAMRNLAPALASPRAAARLLDQWSTNQITNAAVNRLNPMVRSMGAQAAQRYATSGPTPMPAEAAPPETWLDENGNIVVNVHAYP